MITEQVRGETVKW